MTTVAALFVEKGGVYYGLPVVDPWDRERDALRYAGPHPVVAHPPCERWHQLSAVNHKRWGYVINDDGGCFASALASVRKWGGVLEHPAESRAFRFHRIPEPTSRGWQLTIDGDWITEVDQAAYGHRARKRTWLVYRGRTVPPTLNWAETVGSHQIGLFDQVRPQLPTRERHVTPPAFRDALLSIARSSLPREQQPERDTMTREVVSRLDGIFVGMLKPDEIAAFDVACEEGWAYRAYEGAGGFMGLAKVRMRPSPPLSAEER